MAMTRPFLNTFQRTGVYGDHDPCESSRYEFIKEIKKIGFEPTNPEIEIIGFTSETSAMYVSEFGFDAILVSKNRFTYINIGEKKIESGVEFENSKIFLRDLKLKKLINEQA